MNAIKLQTVNEILEGGGNGHYQWRPSVGPAMPA